MSSDLEKLVLGSLALNDETNFYLESLTFNCAQKKPQFASNSEADGETLVKESHYGPATLDLRIRVAPQETADKGREKLGELTDAVQGCERVEGGRALEWTPNESETVYTLYAITGDVPELPIEVTGDNAGWLIKSPVVKVHLVCRPFLYRPETTVLEATESGAEPYQVAYVGEVGGDVPAEARLIVSDKAEQDRRFGAWGLDVVDSESNPVLLWNSSRFTTSGFSGTEVSGHTGAYFGVIRATAVSQPTTICGTGRIEHVGSYGVYLRVYSTSEHSRFRISYKNGDGPRIPLEWKEAPVVNGWAELFMGEVFLDGVSLGEQTSEIRVEQKATEGNPANDVNYLLLWPTTKASGYARGIARAEATNLIGYDNYSGHETGENLEGLEVAYPSGTKWAETNKTGSSGFYIASDGSVQRSKTGDSSVLSGCFAQFGSTTHTTFSESVTIKAGTKITVDPTGLEGTSMVGLLGRYVSTTKWLAAVLVRGGRGSLATFLQVFKNVSGQTTQLAYLPFGSVDAAKNRLPYDIALGLAVFANGNWAATVGPQQTSGYDADLATGGTLASGKVGLYDSYTSAEEGFRGMDGYQLMGAEEPGVVCYSGKQVEFNHEGVLRQDSTGEYDGPPDEYRGAGLELQPAGDQGLINRVAVRMRRNDATVESAEHVEDKQTIEIKARERFLVPR